MILHGADYRSLGAHLDHLVVADADAARIEVAVDEDFHLLSGGRGFRDCCRGGGELHGWNCNSCVLGVLDLNNIVDADRFIVATAISRRASLVTADERLLQWKHALKRVDATR